MKLRSDNYTHLYVNYTLLVQSIRSIHQKLIHKYLYIVRISLCAIMFIVLHIHMPCRQPKNPNGLFPDRGAPHSLRNAPLSAKIRKYFPLRNTCRFIH
jgi:hypothetical protein